MTASIRRVLSRNVKKRTFGHVRPAKIGSVYAFALSDLNIHWAKEAKFHHVDNDE